MPAHAPLILTIEMDSAASAIFDGLRQAHFPPERNLLAAHLTLFHHLPGAEIDAVVGDVERVAAETGPIAMRTAGLRSLGRGVAFVIDAPELVRLRGELAARWRRWLTPQDAQPFRPHVTVQNKVDPAAARALLAELELGVTPFPVTGEALGLWRYRGGPWEAAGRFPFGGESDATGG